ncbi:MAG TPA: beta-ketoacyl-[acyl-carrier-protein] synthase family protein [Ktedonobacterales bacterium]|nr:beta-ketoacyl-[acyl-carrier-protein] synthase family protein [Ktedonobacterales bacterium]
MVYPSVRRVVITGLGVVAPNGIGKQAFWEACVAGRSGIRPITRFDASTLPTRIAGEVPDFDPAALGLTSEECSHIDRNTQFAIAAANLAWQDAGLAWAREPQARTLTEAERDQSGVYMGTAMASSEEAEKVWRRLSSDGAQPLRQLDDVPMSDALLLIHAPAAAIAIHHQLHGPCAVFSTGCSAGADAIGQAFWAIQEGRADRMLAGGSDAAICYSGLDVFNVIGALSTRNDAPERASRPYDGARDGFVMAEGAGVLLLEERELALARGARIYAELIAFVSNSNAYHMTALPQDGMPLQHLLRQILAEADITPAQLGYINSHGSSTPANEAAETAAYKAVFGAQAYHIPISSTKSMIGHTQGAASAIEAIVTTLALHEHMLPPTINQEQPDPGCDLDYIPNQARPAAIELALTHSSGFGGVNTALLLAAPDWSE